MPADLVLLLLPLAAIVGLAVVVAIWRD